jgi:hypothetical protein
VLALREEVSPTAGRLTVELRNDDGRYATPGQDDLSILDIGGQLVLSPGYRTTTGNEASPGPVYSIEAWGHTSHGGKASLVIHGVSALSAAENWRARHQFRWNKSTETTSVKDILAFVLARVGLKLEVKSQSSVITGFYPDFTINPAIQGETILRRLLSFVPDVLFIEGDRAHLVHPLATDSPVYSYGLSHALIEGSYRTGAWPLNRIQVEGYDPVSEEPIVVDSFAWAEIDRLYDRLSQLEDRNIDTADRAQDRGQAYLREAEIESAGGFIRVPANCGQQLYDVIDITDRRAGLEAAKRRVVGLTLVYKPHQGQYEHRLSLGAV